MPRLNHVHDWQPVNHYAGRYRCEVCGWFAYMGSVVGENYRQPNKLYVYHCARCKRPAVGKFRRYGKPLYWACRTHMAGSSI